MSLGRCRRVPRRGNDLVSQGGGGRLRRHHANHTPQQWRRKGQNNRSADFVLLAQGGRGDRVPCCKNSAAVAIASDFFDSLNVDCNLMWVWVVLESLWRNFTLPLWIAPKVNTA